MTTYSGKILGLPGIEDSMTLTKGDNSAVLIGKGGDQLQFVHRGEPRNGYWIPKGWVDGPEREEFEKVQLEYMEIRAVLKSAGHKSAGAHLDHLVDQAIDRERTNLNMVLEIIGEALGKREKVGTLDWMLRARYLAGLITKLREPKPAEWRTEEVRRLGELTSAVNAIAEHIKFNPFTKTTF